MKHLKTLLTTIAVLLCSLTVCAHDFEVGGIYYVLESYSNEYAIVTYGDKKYSGDVVIPETVTYDGITYPVKSIDMEAFNDCIGLTSVVIPNTINQIGYHAFAGCTSLTSINIPEGVTSIDNLIIGCTNLSSITLPNSLEYVYSINFRGTAWYKNHPDGPMYISNWLMGYKGKMPENTTLTIKDGTVGIADGAFKDSTNLVSVSIPNTVKVVGDYAFYRTGLKSITNPDNVENIGADAFRGCANLATVTLSNTNNLKSIGSNAFDETAWYENKPDGMVYLSNWLLNYKGTVTSNTSLTIKSGTVGIADQALDAYDLNEYLTSVSMPNSLKYIGDYAFRGCSALTSVSMSNSVVRIGYSAFYFCSHLSSINLYNNLETIDDYAFSYCSALTEITIPSSLKSIGDHAFYGCDKLQKCHIGSLESWCNIELKGSFCSPLENNMNRGSDFVGLYINGSLIENLVVPSTISEIKNFTFAGNCCLKSVELPNSIQSIGVNAFAGCRNITSVTIPNSVTKISNHAFIATSIPSFEIPKSVTRIIGNPFISYTLSSIKVEEGNPVYDSHNGCNAVIHSKSKILVAGSASTIIPNDVVEIGSFAFTNNKLLTAITIPETVTIIGDYSFAYCQALTSVTMQKGVKHIGASAFLYCDKLKAITLPESIELIGTYAFEGCYNLKSITCKAEVVPTIGERSFYYSTTTLYVPFNVLDDYKAHKYWSKFETIEAINTEVNLLDSAEDYKLTSAVPCQKLNYIRTFNNTNWQALYVPFAMSYEDWAEEFDVAKINDIHQFDEDGDDVLETTKMEIVKVKSGTLKANHPYMIRAKSTGEKTITVENATLMAAETKTIDCSSVELKYTFTGTYETVDGETMVNNNYYAMSGGGLKPTTNTNASLKPFRWYMQITDREGQVVQDVSEVKVVVRGEDDWDATGIDEIETTGNTFVIHGIDGRMVRKVNANTLGEATEGLASGMYVINGKKHIVK